MVFKNTISPEEIEKLKNAEFTGEVTIIEKYDESYEGAIAYLASQKIIGFDTETKPVFQANVRRNSVALLQLASGTRAFIFRLTELGMPDSLCKVLSTKKIIKVGAAVNEDIRGLSAHLQVHNQSLPELRGLLKLLDLNVALFGDQRATHVLLCRLADHKSPIRKRSGKLSKTLPKFPHQRVSYDYTGAVAGTVHVQQSF